MKVNEVPQDNDDAFKGLKELQYAINEDGTYTQVKSSGWQTKSDVMQHAWDVEVEKIIEARQMVLDGTKSPIYFHMYKNFMDVKLLAEYTGFNRFSVKRHLKPKVFANLSEEKLQKYFEVFGLKDKAEMLLLEMKQAN